MRFLLKWRFRSLSPRIPKSIGKPVVISGIGIFVYLLVLISFVFFGNNEYHNRAAQTIVVSDKANGEGLVATLILHKIELEENAIEASVLVTARGITPKRSSEGDPSCFQLSIIDRSSPEQQIFAARSYKILCDETAYARSIEYETPRFLIPVYQSVALYPFDDLSIIPQVQLRSEDLDSNDYNSVNYRVIKTFPGKVLTWNGDPLNWEFHLTRSINEKVLVVLAASLFLGLTLLVSWQMAQPRSGPSGTQDMVAVAGYIIAAAGFRDILGVTKTIGTSVFELAVFVLPLIVLTISIFIGHARRRAYSSDID